MATFITLINFTEQGIRNAKESPNRAAAFAASAEKLGVKVKDIYWTVGHYDAVAIIEGPDDETITSVLLGLGAQGNVRTETLRAFSTEEMSSIVSKMP
ncbi:MAG: GYD domain-containing protein [Gammaproteobacteria bacterium]|nr:MAG: GYD domain-containing protein [Gammaproteobacteria bacterium]